MLKVKQAYIGGGELDSNYCREDLLWLQKNKRFHFVKKYLV